MTTLLHPSPQNHSSRGQHGLDGSLIAGDGSRSRGRAVATFVGIAVAIAAFVGLSALMPLVFGSLALLGGLAVVVWCYPAWSAVALLILVPVNRFLILLVFHFGRSETLTFVVQAWKDLLIGVLLLRAIDEIILRRRFHFHLLDLLVVGFIAMAAVYLIFPGEHERIDMLGRVLGFRADAYFMVAYLVGRGLLFTKQQLRWLLWAIVPGTALVALVAAAQFAAPGWFNVFFNRIGYEAFINGQGGFGKVEVIRNRNIPGVDLPRASSLLLGDLALAFFSMLAVAVAATILVSSSRSLHRWIGAVMVVATVATAALTLTRSAVLAIVPMLILAGLLSGKVFRLAIAGLVLAAGGLVVVVSGVVSIRSLSALADPNEDSAQGHFEAIATSLEVLSEQPLGRGLGTSGTIGQRVLQGDSLTNENWFLQIATEIGLLPGLLFVIITLVAGMSAANAYVQVRDPDLRRIVLTVILAWTGYLVMANVLHAWEVPVVSMAFWLLVGVVVGGGRRDRELEQEPEPDPDSRLAVDLGSL